MSVNPNSGSFEETFGENQSNDVLFFLDETPPKKQEQNTAMTAEEVMNELDLLSYETLNQDWIEKNLTRVIDWFKSISSAEMKQELLSKLPDKLGALFENMKDQVQELDMNTIRKLRMALKSMEEVDLLKDYLESLEREHNLKGVIETRFQEVKEELKSQSKKIEKERKNQKKFERRRRLCAAQNKDHRKGKGARKKVSDKKL